MENPFEILENRLITIERMLQELLDIQKGNQNDTISEPDQTFNIAELAKYLRCSNTTIHRYKNDGVIPFFQTGRKVYFKKSEVDKHLSSNYNLNGKRKN